MKVEELSVVRFQFVFHFFNVYRALEFFGHARHIFVLVINTTGDDVVEVVEARVYVEGKAVHAHPTTQVHTDGTNLPFGLVITGGNPNAGVPFFAVGFNAIFRERTHDCFFEIAHVLVHIGKETVEIKDGVAHNLARAMVGNIASAVDLVKSKTAFAQLFFIEQKIVGRPRFSQGVNGRMLAKKKVVSLFFFRLTGFSAITIGQLAAHQFFVKNGLIVPGLLVIDPAEIAKHHLRFALCIQIAPLKCYYNLPTKVALAGGFAYLKKENKR